MRIYTDDKDRHVFLERARREFDGDRLSVLAWSLMLNHPHLFTRTASDSLSKAMHCLGSGYASYFNCRHKGWFPDYLIEEVCEHLEVDPAEMRAGRRGGSRSDARAAITWLAYTYLNMSLTDLAPRLGVSQPALSFALERGRSVVSSELETLEESLVEAGTVGTNLI